MINPIPISNFFATKTIGELILEMDQLPNKASRSIAYLYAMQMMNACHQAVAKEMARPGYEIN
jgi:hypothetical protein